MKQVQISEDLFLSLIKHHILEYNGDKEKIVKELQQKFDSVVNRSLYTKYKTAPSEEEREKARQDFLSAVLFQFCNACVNDDDTFYIRFYRHHRHAYLFYCMYS